MAQFQFEEPLPTPAEMLGWNDGGGVDINTALEYFTVGTHLPIEFDNLNPVFYSFDPRERERSFGSYAGIDDFIGGLPVKQMYNVYAKLYAGNHDLLHEYIMMLKWLKASMTISNITRNHLHDRLSFLQAYLQYTRMTLDEHSNRYKDMKADDSVDKETIYLHKKDGFHKKRGYNIFVYLSMAMTVINVLAKQVDKTKLQQCQCTKCMFYRSPDGRQKKHNDMTPATLPRMRFYRRESKGVSPSEEIYRKQREKK